MKFNGEIKDIKLIGREVFVTLSTYNQTILEELEELKNNKKPIESEIKKKRNKRSKDANAYLWVLCDLIAEKTQTTKLDIYRDLIHNVGQFEVLPIKNEAVEGFINAWRT